jgi:hypothetical protein
MTEQAIRVNERKRLATALRWRATDILVAASWLAAVPHNAKAAKQGVLEAAVVRNVADLIEEGAL